MDVIYVHSPLPSEEFRFRVRHEVAPWTTLLFSSNKSALSTPFFPRRGARPNLHFFMIVFLIMKNISLVFDFQLKMN